MWIGYGVLDRLLSYPEEFFLSRSTFPIQFSYLCAAAGQGPLGLHPGFALKHNLSACGQGRGRLCVGAVACEGIPCAASPTRE